MDRESVRAIPDGEYSAEGSLDNDGVTDDPVDVKVTVRIDGDEMEVDLSGSSAQCTGSVNCGLVQTRSAIEQAIKFLVNPTATVSGGNFRNLRTVVPEGSCFNPAETAPCLHYGPHLMLAMASLLLFTPLLGILRTFRLRLWSSVTRSGFSSMAFGKTPVELGVGLAGWELFANTRCFLPVDFSSGSSVLVLHPGAFQAVGTERPPDVSVILPGQKPRQIFKVNAMPIPAGTRVLVKTGGGGGWGIPQEKGTG